MVWFLIVIIGLLADQVTKFAAQSYLGEGGDVPVLGDLLHFEYHVNTGAAWSFLADNSWGIYLLSAVSLVACVLFAVALYKATDKRLKLCLSLVLAGTAGNMIDRVFRKGVIDFISLRFGDYHFPIFNVADSLLVVGLILLILMLLFTDLRYMFDSPKESEMKEKADKAFDETEEAVEEAESEQAEQTNAQADKAEAAKADTPDQKEKENG